MGTNLLKRIEDATPGGSRPNHEDCDIIMQILYVTEDLIGKGMLPSDVVTKQTGVPYVMAEHLAEHDAKDLYSKSMTPFADTVKTGDETADALMFLLTSYIQGFARGLTLHRNEDMSELVKEAGDFQDALRVVFGDIDRDSIEWAGKMCAIRMMLFTKENPPENELWPHMSQWYDGFVAGWCYTNAKAVRNVGL